MVEMPDFQLKKNAKIQMHGSSDLAKKWNIVWMNMLLITFSLFRTDRFMYS